MKGGGRDGNGVSEAIRRAITRVLDEDARTAEPMNALIVWTELGKGLCGTLDRKGADIGLLGRVVDRWCRERGAADVELARWAYRVDPERRLDATALAAALGRVQGAIEPMISSIAETAGDDGGRAAFLAVAEGWFPVGLTLLRRLPAGAAAGERELLGALRGWCERFLPRDTAGPAELGVRVVKG